MGRRRAAHSLLRHLWGTELIWAVRVGAGLQAFESHYVVGSTRVEQAFRPAVKLLKSDGFSR